jgi:hypothetical protein
MGFSYIIKSTSLKLSDLRGALAFLFVMSASINATAQTPENTLPPGIEIAPSEDTKMLEVREQKQIELAANGEGDVLAINGYNFGYFKGNAFRALNNVVNPRLAATLRKVSSIKLLSPQPILVDEELNPIYAPTEYQTRFQERLSNLRTNEGYFDIMGLYIYIPELKEGVWGVRPEQMLSSKVMSLTQNIYTEVDPSYESWVKLQIELGNYCIMDASGVPSIHNLPEIGKADMEDKVLLEMRAKAYSSLVKRWYFFYTSNAKKILPTLLPGWDKLANANELYNAMATLQTPKQPKK